MKYLIPNAPIPNDHIGDLVIIYPLLELIKRKDEKSTVVIHSNRFPINRYEFDGKSINYKSRPLKKISLIKKVFMIIKFVIYFFIFKLGLGKFTDFLKEDMLQALFKDYQDSDIVIFSGGGYLRHESGRNQFVSLLTNLFLINTSKIFNNRKIISPITFGPFKYKVLEKIAAMTLQGLDLIFCREKVTYSRLRSLGVKNLNVTHDLAFLLDKIKIPKKHSGVLTIGCVFRNWSLNDELNSKLDKVIIEALRSLPENYKNVQILPIVQSNRARVNGIPNEVKVSSEITKSLTIKGLRVLPIKFINDIPSALKTYSSVDLVLAMRFHGSLLSISQGKLFIAINRGKKMLSALKDIGLEDRYLDVENINAKLLRSMLIRTINNRSKIESRIQNISDGIKKADINKWNKALTLDCSQ